MIESLKTQRKRRRIWHQGNVFERSGLWGNSVTSALSLKMCSFMSLKQPVSNKSRFSNFDSEWKQRLAKKSSTSLRNVSCFLFLRSFPELTCFCRGGVWSFVCSSAGLHRNFTVHKTWRKVGTWAKKESIPFFAQIWTERSRVSYLSLPVSLTLWDFDIFADFLVNNSWILIKRKDHSDLRIWSL